MGHTLYMLDLEIVLPLDWLYTIILVISGPPCLHYCSCLSCLHEDPSVYRFYHVLFRFVMCLGAIKWFWNHNNSVSNFSSSLITFRPKRGTFPDRLLLLCQPVNNCTGEKTKRNFTHSDHWSAHNVPLLFHLGLVLVFSSFWRYLENLLLNLIYERCII